MEVTRSVILDLLPLYLAEEASADTRALVAKHLETDPELARAAREMMGSGRRGTCRSRSPRRLACRPIWRPSVCNTAVRCCSR